MLNQFNTVKEVKDYLRANCEKGVSCPCCDQNVKVYNRPIHEAMAVCLINLYRLTSKKGPDYYHITEFGANKTTVGDFAKLRYWGLIVEMKKDPDETNKRTSGYWKITQKGKFFVEGSLSVPKHVRIYNKKKIGLVGDDTTIQDVLDKKFDYQELMNS